MKKENVITTPISNGHTPGTILDGRYRIVREIGRGGFGVTYEAVNIHNSLRVAVKECRKENTRFLQEARVLRDFADEPSVVTVLDHFEEKGAAYIVMEYLDGITVTEDVCQNGKWSAETAVRRFVPVMEALDRMHRAGVIHLDISPDNLMLMPNGSVILMDFGAVKQADTSGITRAAIYKEIYSPPEQRDGTYGVGSWTDVYALCATIYFCITGTEPEDTLSRLLFDELQKPSEAGADILPRAEKALLSGLALMPSDRTQDIRTLRQELEAAYPDLTEEEKRAVVKRRRRRRNLAISCICAALALCLLLSWVFRVQILFMMTDTETIALDGSSMTEDAFRHSSAAVKERVRAFAEGRPYLWREEGRQIYVEMPADDLAKYRGVSIQDIVRSSLTRPMVLSVYSDTQQIPYHKIGVFSQEEDLARVDISDSSAEVSFTEEAASRFGGLLDRKGEQIAFIFDADDNYSKKLMYQGLTLGDGKSVRVERLGYLLSYTEDLYIKSGAYTVPMELQKLHFTQNPSEDAFLVHAEWQVQWERAEDALFPGRNQCNVSELRNRTISVRYAPSRSGAAASGLYDPASMSFQAVLKNRLDSLGIPYAVGKDLQADGACIVRVPADQVWMEELYNMGRSLDGVIELGDSSSSEYRLFSELLIEEKGDGRFSLILKPYSMHRDKIKELLHKISGQEDQRLVLYFDNYPVACCDCEEALRSLEEGMALPFDRWMLADYPEMNAETRHFADFLVAAYRQKPQENYYMDTSSIEITDENGKLVYFDYEDRMPEAVTLRGDN